MWVISIFALLISRTLSQDCIESITTVSGTHAPAGKICKGQLIFEENFNDLDLKKWQHEQTLGGDGFQWYTNNRTNSYVEKGILHIKPTFVADQFGNDFLYNGTLDINGGYPADACTNPAGRGCIRTGKAPDIINPIKSARINTVNSFSFKYGTIVVKAKLPAGDWLWPAILMMPRYNMYSSWPSSGEIDIVESRGNLKLTSEDKDTNKGVKVQSSLHWGPDYNYDHDQFTKHKIHMAGYETGFHCYQLTWTPEVIYFFVDASVHLTVKPREGGFWEMGRLNNTGLENPWKGGSKMAPFDQEFFLIINLAVGSSNDFFPENSINKPWKNWSPTAMKEFWEGREQWLPTWDLVNGKSHLQVNYVKVWAL